MDPEKLTPGQRAYEAKRAAKAGMTLEAWLRDKEKRARAEAAEMAKAAKAEVAPAKKPGFFARLLERAQKPL
jgi:3-hydroxyisobutyrate dehydrogenase-like beta-hydroxyacid dehydrogenase